MVDHLGRTKGESGPTGGVEILGDIIGAVLGFSAAEQAGDDRVAAQASADATARENTRLSIASAEKLNAENQGLQREFAQMGVRWRVQDAVAAGLHPLYALSSGGAAYSPTIAMGNIHQAGQVGGDDGSRYMSGAISSLARLGDALERKFMEAQVDQAKADAAKDYAMASAVDSLAATNRQAQMATSPFPMPVVSPSEDVYSGRWQGTLLSPGFASDTVKHEPAEVLSSRSETPYVTAGVAPGHSEYLLGKVPGSQKDFRALLPASRDMGEALEAIAESTVLMAAWIQMNVNHYGAGWLYDAAKFIPVVGQFLTGSEWAGEKIGGAIADAVEAVAPAVNELGHRAQDWVRSRRVPRRAPPKWPYK